MLGPLSAESLMRKSLRNSFKQSELPGKTNLPFAGLFSFVYSCYCPFNSARLARSLRVARKSVFFAVSSVVLNISPIVRSFNP